MRNDEKLNIVFAGDFFVGSTEKDKLSEETISFFKGMDQVCVNFEGPLTDEKSEAIKKAGPNLKQSNQAVSILTKLNTTIALLANNHSMDYGMAAMLQTKERLSREHIEVIGAGIGDAYEIAVFEKNGIKLGIINAAENGYGCADGKEEGYAYIFHPLLERQIRFLKKEVKCDYVIGAFHAGAEGIDYPLPEWREAYHKLIDEGLDIIIAHHPHVIQGREIYSGKPIYYSLGNFLWQNGTNQTDKRGMLVMLTVNREQGLSHSVCFVDGEGNLLVGEEAEKERERFEELSRVLQLDNEEEYQTIITGECVSKYRELYEKYYFDMLGMLRPTGNSTGRNLKCRLLNVYYSVFKKHHLNHQLLYHMLKIETHRWLCMKAIESIERDK